LQVATIQFEAMLDEKDLAAWYPFHFGQDVRGASRVDPNYAPRGNLGECRQILGSNLGIQKPRHIKR
jgi:hypothetical protein